MLKENPMQQTKGVLDNPKVMREKMLLKPESSGKSKAWIFKLILIILIIALILYLFTHPESIRSFTNNYFNTLLK